jgi:tight adherence protein B
MSAELAVMELTALLRAGTSAKNARTQFPIANLSSFQRKQFDFIWLVATDSGGALAKGLDRLASVFAQQNRQLAELKIAFASPKATANLILVLPLLAVLFSELLGLSALAASVGTSLGAVSVGIGLILLIVARVSSLRMLEAAKPRELDPGAFLDAISIALSAGLSPKSAAAMAKSRFSQTLLEEVSSEQWLIFWEAVKASEQSGIALTGLLAARADSLRFRMWNNHRAVISKLQIKLMIPLGLAALPAFVLLAVVPVGIGLFSSQT